MTTSRPRMRCSSAPMPTAVAAVSASRPATGLTPSRTAPEAPAKPTCVSASAANVRPRRTTKYPTIPHTIAATVPARSASRMNAYAVSSCQSTTGFQEKLSAASSSMVGVAVVEADDHDATAAVAQDLDRVLVQRAQALRRDDLLGRSGR